MDQENEMSFEERLKKAADLHEQAPAPDVWLKVRDQVLVNRRSRNWKWLWGGSLLVAFLVGVISSEYVLNSVHLTSGNLKPDQVVQETDRKENSENRQKQNQLSPAQSFNVPDHSANHSASGRSDSALYAQLRATKVESSKAEAANSNSSANSKKAVSGFPASFMSSSYNSELKKESAENSFAKNKWPSNNSTENTFIVNSINHDQQTTFHAEQNAGLDAAFLPEKTILLSDLSAHQIQYREQKTPAVLPLKSSKPLNATIEADFIPFVNYVWNKFPTTNYGQLAFGDSLAFTKKPDRSSFHFNNNFSSGINFYAHLNKILFVGGGLHYTKTTLQIDYPINGYRVSDSEYVYSGAPVDSLLLVTTSEGYTNPQLRVTNNWLDFSAMFGIRFFPQSKNHLQWIAGGAYSYLLSTSLSSPFLFNGSHGGSTLSYGNQLQLFTEVDYVRDLGEHFGASAGLQIHYYPFNLVTIESVSQHQLWIGLKVGLNYNFIGKTHINYPPYEK